MTSHEAGTAGSNEVPPHTNAILALNQPEPRSKANNYRNSTFGDDSADRKSERSSRNGRPVEPKPDALWHTPNREAWATVGGRHYPVQSPDFRHWLAGEFYRSNGDPAGSYKLDELVSTYSAEALFRGRERRVHLRTAQRRRRRMAGTLRPE